MQNLKCLPCVLLRNQTALYTGYRVTYGALTPKKLSNIVHNNNNSSCNNNWGLSNSFLHTSTSEKRASTLSPTAHAKSDSNNGANTTNSYSRKITTTATASNNKNVATGGQKRNLAFAINQTQEKVCQHEEESSFNADIAAVKQYYLDSASNERLTRSHDFARRHIGPREEDKVSMLATLGYGTMEELIADTVPNEIRFNRSLNLPKQLNEQELLVELQKIAQLNDCVNWKSYLGMGYHDCVTPTVILRNMFENPGWTTAYTAYQAEIAQGRLESLMNYQTMIKDLTGMDIANASLLDEATAAAEAMQMCLRYHKSKRNKFLVSVRCHPQTIAVIKTRADALQVDIEVFDELKQSSSLSTALSCDSCDSEIKALNDYDLSQFSGIIIQYPNTNGYLYDIDKLTQQCSQVQCLVVAATDLLACTMFKAPGDFQHPADIAIGTSQRFGVPLNYGGPHAGLLACRHKLTRLMPGRVVGLTRDSNGDSAYRFALQTREQHIRRDKATSNICTAQALLANMSAMYAVYHGPKGLKEIATDIHSKTGALIAMINQQQKPQNDPLASVVNETSYFDTITIKCRDEQARELIESRAREAKINLRYYTDQIHIGISLDETSKLSDLATLAGLFACEQVNDNDSNNDDNISDGKSMYKWLHDKTTNLAVNSSLRSLVRQTSYLNHATFNSYRSEAQLTRYMKHLENKDISLVHSMIPLGSCTMKLNSTTQMIPSSWDHFTKCHPFQPVQQCSGYAKLFQDLDEYLCEITGYDRISFQPNSGAQGEYTGLRVIKAYLESIGQPQRNVCLIPVSAHGTNPASAQMAGFDIETIKVMPNGNIDMEHLKACIEKHENRIACLMITYPSTFGVFEEGIVSMCQLIHEAGGQVYMDGANMNAQVGLSRPGDFGSDVSHLNLHKTFCIPHGGGGPGAGPIGVKKHLIPFLPNHPLVSGDHYGSNNKMDQSFGTVSASMFGSPAILPISWAYIRLMSHNLRQSSEMAILNANYMKKRLESDYKILFRGTKGNVAHEFILDIRPFKKSVNIEAVDIAKRLQDFGLHAPTVSFPITNTLMLEPTESEDKQQLDRYVDALLVIRQEISDIESGKLDKEDNPIKRAPHTQKVVCSSNWHRKYTREQAAFPAHNYKYNSTAATKIWPSVGRVDDTYGDTNLFCTCPPPPSTASEQVKL